MTFGPFLPHDIFVETATPGIHSRELEYFAEHTRHLARISLFMIGAGMICLVAGIIMLVAGLAGDQGVWLEFPGVTVTATGFGAVTLAISAVWGFLAYKTAPQLNFRRTAKAAPAENEVGTPKDPKK